MQNFFGESIHLMHEGVDIIASEAYCGCQIAHTISFALLFQLYSLKRAHQLSKVLCKSQSSVIATGQH